MARVHLLGAWSGIAFIVFLFIGFVWLAGFMPAISPADTPEQVAALYQEETMGIRLGMAVLIAASIFFLPWVAAISECIRQIDGDHSFYKSLQTMCGTAAFLFFLIPGMIFEVAAFRPERSPEITQLLNDIGWLFFLTPFPPFVLQALVIGLAILKDKRATPILPRWLGYLCLWNAVLLIPAVIAFFFKTGPFAWNGIFPYWIPFAIFTIWMIAITVCMIKAINRSSATV